MTATRFEQVTFSYPGDDSVVLQEASFSIPEGCFALVVGPTGAGKSTLLRAVNGLVPHFSGGSFSGRVVTAGRDTARTKPRAMADAVAFVPQDPGASFVLETVEDELAYAMENLGVPPAIMRRRIEEVLDLLALESLRARSVRSLSGGERQRVAIAAALTAGPGILVLDEPTSQLDPQGAEDVLAALHRLVHDLGVTVIAAEHRLERVVTYADRAIGVRDGEAVAGDPREILAEFAPGPPVMRLGRALGWRPLPLSVREARRRASSFALGTPPERPLPPRGRPLVAASTVTAAYGDRIALSAVSISVTAGEVVALMGRNGSGKSTLLKVLAGVMEPSRGTVQAPHGSPRPGVDVALCPQEPESVLFRARVRDEIAATPSSRLPDEILEQFGLGGVADRHPRDLSSGRRLLVAAAAMAATGAPVLLLDEPTRGLDPETKEQLGDLLRGIAAGGGAVMFATHDVELAAACSGRVVMLAGGELIADGSPRDVLGDSPIFAPQMSRVFGPGWLTPRQVVAALDGGPADV